MYIRFNAKKVKKIPGLLGLIDFEEKKINQVVFFLSD